MTNSTIFILRMIVCVCALVPFSLSYYTKNYDPTIMLLLMLIFLQGERR